MNRKLIFLDIDGTMVDFKTRMPETTQRVLKLAVDAGHSLVINTGRLAAQVYPWIFEKAHFDGFISSSGANILWKGEHIGCRFWSHEQVSTFCEAALSVGAAVFGYTEKSMIAMPGALEHQIEFFSRFGLERWQYRSLIDNVVIADPRDFDNIEKGIYIDSGHSISEMQRLMGDSFKIDEYSFGSIPPTSGEVTIRGVTKASAIDILCEKLGIPLSDTIAIGDGSNDIEMVSHAGVGIAMGNAVEPLKAVADYVTDDILSDGLAKAFERFELVG